VVAGKLAASELYNNIDIPTVTHFLSLSTTDGRTGRRLTVLAPASFTAHLSTLTSLKSTRPYNEMDISLAKCQRTVWPHTHTHARARAHTHTHTRTHLVFGDTWNGLHYMPANTYQKCPTNIPEPLPIDGRPQEPARCANSEKSLATTLSSQVSSGHGNLGLSPLLPMPRCHGVSLEGHQYNTIKVRV